MKLDTACSTCFRKKKKKKNKAEEVVEIVEKVEARTSTESDKRTPAQVAYDKVQEKRVNSMVTNNYILNCYKIIQQAERILKKAQKTHKQRVEVIFN